MNEVERTRRREYELMGIAFANVALRSEDGDLLARRAQRNSTLCFLVALDSASLDNVRVKTPQELWRDFCNEIFRSYQDNSPTTRRFLRREAIGSLLDSGCYPIHVLDYAPEIVGCAVRDRLRQVLWFVAQEEWSKSSSRK